MVDEDQRHKENQGERMAYKEGYKHLPRQPQGDMEAAGQIRRIKKLRRKRRAAFKSIRFLVKHQLFRLTRRKLRVYSLRFVVRAYFCANAHFYALAIDR